MTELTIDTSWFNHQYNNALSALHDLASAAVAAGTAPEAHDSQSSIRFYDNYSYFCRTICQIVNIMINDWDIINVWVNDIIIYDVDVSQLLHGVQRHVDSRHVSINRRDSFEGYLSQNTINISTASYEVNYRQSFASSALLHQLFMFKDRIAELDSSLAEYQDTILQFTTLGNCIQGVFANNVKNYMSQVHTRFINAMRTIVSEFQDYIAEYVLLYFDSMHETDYDYELNDVIDFYQNLEFVRNDLISSHSSIASYIRTNSGYVSLQSLPDIEDWGFYNQINNTIHFLSDVATNIRVAERRGKVINYDLWFDIMNLSRAAGELSQSWTSRLSGYRGIETIRGFNRYTSMIIDDGVDSDPLLCNFHILVCADRDDANVAGQFIRNSMVNDLITFYENRNCDRYSYDSYSGYDNDILRPMIDGLDLSDKSLRANAAELYSTFVANGFPSDKAMLLTEETLLFNTEALKNAVNIENAYNALALDAIRNYVVDFTIYTADNPAHGYCQVNRWSTDFDCSSLCVASYEKAGLRLQDMECDVPRNPVTHDFTPNHMSPYGFVKVEVDKNNPEASLIPGDFLVDTSSHSEIYIGNGETVSAHSSEDVYNGKASDTANGAATDQLQGISVDKYEKDTENEADGIERGWYYRVHVTPELEHITNRENGTDANGHDRIGEIRVESIYKPSSEITEDTQNKLAHNFNYFYRLESLDFFTR